MIRGARRPVPPLFSCFLPSPLSRSGIRLPASGVGFHQRKTARASRRPRVYALKENEARPIRVVPECVRHRSARLCIARAVFWHALASTTAAAMTSAAAAVLVLSLFGTSGAWVSPNALRHARRKGFRWGSGVGSSGRISLSAAVPTRSSRRRLCRRGNSNMAVEPDNPTFVLAVLGDLHLDPKDMGAHEEARDQITRQMEAEAFLMETENLHVVSLGDLGAYGSAGTTRCFELARDYLDGFQAPVDIVSGNHDLEGLNEFATDRENLSAFQAAFDKDSPQFATVIAEKTLCLGLSTVRFRDAEGSSHEVFIDEDQMQWFEHQLAAHSKEDGWKVIVFSHAPPMGSGLRVVQGVHIKNQCAWLNHSVGDRERRHFVRMCRKYGNIRAWFSGHFHLSHDYEDSISMVDGCAFVQVGVIGEKSTRDGRRQTRLVRGTEECLQVYTVSHHVEGAADARLDLTLNYDDPTHPVIAHGHEDYDHSSWFSAYRPEEEDGCYLDHRQLSSGGGAAVYSEGVRCWWHMDDGRVLGVHDGMVVEYDDELLAPIGVVRDKEQLRGRDVVVVEGGGALMLVPKEGIEGGSSGDPASDIEVIHPNAKGGYSTVFQRNKAVRTKEMEREELAQQWIRKNRS